MSASRNRLQWHVFVFLAPALLIYAAFSALPLLDTLRLGLYTSDDHGLVSFAGLDNYRTILAHGRQVLYLYRLLS